MFLHIHSNTHMLARTHTLKTYPMRLELKKIEIENIANLFLGFEKTARISESWDACVMGTVTSEMALG